MENRPRQEDITIELGEEDMRRFQEAANNVKLIIDFDFPTVELTAVISVVGEAAKMAAKAVLDVYNTHFPNFGEFVARPENRRIAHLALHAKKRRARKKNRYRLLIAYFMERERVKNIDEKDIDKGN